MINPDASAPQTPSGSQVVGGFLARFGDILAHSRRHAPVALSSDNAHLADPAGKPVAAIRDGVIDFVSPSSDDRGDDRGFAYQWNKILAGNLSDKVVYANTRDALMNGVREYLGLDRDWFQGKTCADMGCGHGQYVRGFAEMGAKALGVDLSEVAYRCQMEDRVLNPDLDTTYIRADLLNLPIVEKAFDCVISIGVSNATPDARAACISVARRVKPGGHFLFYNYEKGEVGYVNVREWFPFLTRLPRPVLLWVCKAMALPLAFYLTGRRGKLPTPQTIKTAYLGLFDAIEPTYCWTYTPEVILGWLNDPEANLTGVKRVSRCMYAARGK